MKRKEKKKTRLEDIPAPCFWLGRMHMKVPGPISFNTVRYFSGQHFLPNDNEMDLQSIRDWAIKKE
jgi:hypothetical protein